MVACRAYLKSYVPGVLTQKTESINEDSLRERFAQMMNRGRCALHFNENGQLVNNVTPDELVIEITPF